MAKKSQDPNADLPLGLTGVFVACLMNGDAHAFRVALEIKRTKDVNQKIRHSVHCPFCNSRSFINNWIPRTPAQCKGPPYAGTMNLVQAVNNYLQPANLSDERQVELLAELGLRMAPSPVPIPGPHASYPVPHAPGPPGHSGPVWEPPPPTYLNPISRSPKKDSPSRPAKDPKDR